MKKAFPKERDRAIKDDDIAKEPHDKDFTDITMPTGHDAAKFAHPPLAQNSRQRTPLGLIWPRFFSFEILFSNEKNVFSFPIPKAADPTAHQ